MDLENQRNQRGQGQQYFEMDQDQNRKSQSSSISLGSDRIGFIRKVYGIITTQLFFTVLMCFWAYSSVSFQQFQMRNYVLLILAVIISIIIQIAIICFQQYHIIQKKRVARKVPTNYICLGLFTLCESYIVSSVCSHAFIVYSQNGGQVFKYKIAQLVLAAALLTLGVSTALTYYACTTKSDFTMMGGLLYVVSMALLLLLLFNFLFQSPLLHMIYLCSSSVLFGLYLIYDTQLVAGGKVIINKYLKRNMLDMDDYIVGALIIYVDIIVLFLDILNILLILFGKKD